MAWVYLVIAGFLEVGWAIGLKYTEGFTRLAPTALTVAAMVASIVLLGIALRDLPVGTGYAVWTGIGTVGAAILGMVLFGDPATLARLISIGLIIGGIAGLNYCPDMDLACRADSLRLALDAMPEAVESKPQPLECGKKAEVPAHPLSSRKS